MQKQPLIPNKKILMLNTITQSVPTFLVSQISFAIRAGGGGYVSEKFQILSLN
jgi:hypothetical protein